MAIFMFMKRKIISVIFLFLTLIITMEKIGKEFVYSQENISMYSLSYALMDGDTKRILEEKESDSPMANASTTKILTCIITLESCSLEDMVTVSSEAASQPKVRMGLEEGKEYLLKDLVYGLMLESYNDCAYAIAEHVAGNVENFAKLMNQKAKEIGCKDTYFITPNGLDAENEMGFHHSTAEDLCRIMAYCTWDSPKKEEFLKITQTRNYASFVNRNAFLNQMDGVLTGKTGFTNKAGYCYVAAMEMNGEHYTIALLGCGWPNNKSYKWKDARTLFEYGMNHYDKRRLEIGETNQEVNVDGYVGKSLFKNINKKAALLLCAEDKTYDLLLAEDEKIKKEIVIYTNNSNVVSKGQIMGECNIYLDDVLIDSFPLKANDNSNIWGWREIIHTIFYQFLTFSE